MKSRVVECTNATRASEWENRGGPCEHSPAVTSERRPGLMVIYRLYVFVVALSQTPRQRQLRLARSRRRGLCILRSPRFLRSPDSLYVRVATIIPQQKRSTLHEICRIVCVILLGCGHRSISSSCGVGGPSFFVVSRVSFLRCCRSWCRSS